ncbi:hematopoietic prostaglandin D synthase isoform X1 [Procambarus clarkii]|uniref:hematopoietic prostaglandin D synthase isoform X1 n=1 Tax=Procambarus clarkii TaxID=6728 RepID=UPI001E675BEF|nr:hematopoietic prostaglandin D synthase-like isoform X2 [Procambarus clarkii]
MTRTRMTYHLAYLDLRARGEPVRWILRALDVPFTEERIDLLENWIGRKHEFEWGRVPVLVCEGQQLHQTTTICRYLGEKHHLASTDIWKAALQQEVVEAFHDASAHVAFTFFARMRQDKVQQQFMWEKVKTRLPELVQILEARITDQGWIRSCKMTWVDVFVAAYLDLYKDYLPGLLDSFPKSKELMDRVKALPSIKAWIEKRPNWHKFEEPQGLV